MSIKDDYLEFRNTRGLKTGRFKDRVEFLKFGKHCMRWPDDQGREATVHRVGNLALLSRRKNNQAKNFEFDKKKEKYFKRDGVVPFALTTGVLNETEWTPEVVRRRQDELVGKLKDIWDLQLPKRHPILKAS